MIWDPCVRCNICREKLAEQGMPLTSEWARRRLVHNELKLLHFNLSSPLDGFQKMALFSWAIERLTQTDRIPFVLEYTDFRPPNIMFQGQSDITYMSGLGRTKCRVIDLDSIQVWPGSLSTMALEQRLYTPNYMNQNISHRNFHVVNPEGFENELHRIQLLESRVSTSPLNQQVLQSEEVFFLCYLFRYGLTRTVIAFPEMVKDILQKSSCQTERIKNEWHRFAALYYTSRGRPIPDWAQYIEIQEGLGLMRNYHKKNIRRLKKRGQELLKHVFELISSILPQHKWVIRKQCYLTAAVSHSYILPIWGSGPCS